MGYLEYHKRSKAFKILTICIVLINLIGITYLINRRSYADTVGGYKRHSAEGNSRNRRFDRTHLKLGDQYAPNSTAVNNHIAAQIPNLPIEDLTNKHYKNRNHNQTCAWYPTFLDIKIHNDYWQEFQNRNISVYIFGAYFDNRPTVTYNDPLVRVLTTMHFIAEKDEDYPLVYCQIWYKEQSKPVISPVKDMRRIWHYYWGHGSQHNYAHLLGCPVMQEHKNWIPETVSLVVSPCDKATNNVKVIYEPLKEGEAKKRFAVCVKGLDFPYIDMSHRLVEYMETMRSLGAEKITMYQLQVHPNTTKVLKYYERTGYLEYLPFSLSGEVANLGEYRHMEMSQNGFSYMLHEVIPYNDCLYRNMYRFNYVAVVDVDEIPMPKGNYSTWHDLMDFGESYTNDNCQNFASFCFRCIYFPRYTEKPRYTLEIPAYFYMMQHVHRVREHIRPDWATKCLHSTERVIATHNHFSMHYTWNTCPAYSFEAADAQLQHYREPPIKLTLADPVVDTNIWRFKDAVIERSMKVFEDLNFFEEINVD